MCNAVGSRVDQVHVVRRLDPGVHPGVIGLIETAPVVPYDPGGHHGLAGGEADVSLGQRERGIELIATLSGEVLLVVDGHAISKI